MKHIIILSKYTLTIIVLLGLLGCRTLVQLNKIVNPKTYMPLTNESFVVLPFNNYIDQIELASKVEGIMTQVGLNIVSSPRGLKEVEVRKGAGIAQDSNGNDLADRTIQREESQSIRIEKYMTAAEEAKADYIVETLWSKYMCTIKFIRKSDHKVISVFTEYDSRLEDKLIEQLIKMKFLSQLQDNSSNNK